MSWVQLWKNIDLIWWKENECNNGEMKNRISILLLLCFGILTYLMLTSAACFLYLPKYVQGMIDTDFIISNTSSCNRTIQFVDEDIFSISALVESLKGSPNSNHFALLDSQISSEVEKIAQEESIRFLHTDHNHCKAVSIYLYTIE